MNNNDVFFVKLSKEKENNTDNLYSGKNNETDHGRNFTLGKIYKEIGYRPIGYRQRKREAKTKMQAVGNSEAKEEFQVDTPLASNEKLEKYNCLGWVLAPVTKKLSWVHVPKSMFRGIYDKSMKAMAVCSSLAHLLKYKLHCKVTIGKEADLSRFVNIVDQSDSDIGRIEQKYIIAIRTGYYDENDNDYHFIKYSNGEWTQKIGESNLIKSMGKNLPKTSWYSHKYNNKGNVPICELDQIDLEISPIMENISALNVVDGQNIEVILADVFLKNNNTIKLPNKSFNLFGNCKIILEDKSKIKIVTNDQILHGSYKIKLGNSPWHKILKIFVRGQSQELTIPIDLGVLVSVKKPSGHHYLEINFQQGDYNNTICTYGWETKPPLREFEVECKRNQGYLQLAKLNFVDDEGKHDCFCKKETLYPDTGDNFSVRLSDIELAKDKTTPAFMQDYYNSETWYILVEQ